MRNVLGPAEKASGCRDGFGLALAQPFEAEIMGKEDGGQYAMKKSESRAKQDLILRNALGTHRL
jgi:hypothetical protein